MIELLGWAIICAGFFLAGLTIGWAVGGRDNIKHFEKGYDIGCKRAPVKSEGYETVQAVKEALAGCTLLPTEVTKINDIVNFHAALKRDRTCSRK